MPRPIGPFNWLIEAILKGSSITLADEARAVVNQTIAVFFRMITR